MKKEIVIGCLFSCCISFSLALAQDKVVVIPLNSTATTKVAGTDKQIQYNDNGTQAGANVFYNKTNGWVGIGVDTPKAALNIYNDVESRVSLESPPNELLFTTNPSSSKIEMFGGDDNQLFMWLASDTQTSKPYIMGGRARGTLDNLSAVQAGDHLFGIFTKGYATDEQSLDFIGSAGIAFFATENWANPDGVEANSSRGTAMIFQTTENGTGEKVKRMHIHHNGNVGIGTAGAPLSKLAVVGLPTSPPDASGNAGVVCVTNDGNFWLDISGADCL